MAELPGSLCARKDVVPTNAAATAVVLFSSAANATVAQPPTVAGNINQNLVMNVILSNHVPMLRNILSHVTERCSICSGRSFILFASRAANQFPVAHLTI
jgi:hypothetical protein